MLDTNEALDLIDFRAQEGLSLATQAGKPGGESEAYYRLQSALLDVLELVREANEARNAPPF